MFQPVIKWSGSKRSQCGKIIENFPRKIKTYYEPFIGGGYVLRALLESNIEVENYVCSDVNEDLINLWWDIRNKPNKLISDYNSMWRELNNK